MRTAEQMQNPNASAHDAMWAARVFTDAAEHSRAYLEKSLRVAQQEALELLNRRLDHNGTAISQYQSCKDFADLMTAQHKWFTDLNRDYIDAWLRFNDAAQRIMSDGIAAANNGVEESVRHEERREIRRQEAARQEAAE